MPQVVFMIMSNAQNTAEYPLQVNLKIARLKVYEGVSDITKTILSYAPWAEFRLIIRLNHIESWLSTNQNGNGCDLALDQLNGSEIYRLKGATKSPS